MKPQRGALVNELEELRRHVREMRLDAIDRLCADVPLLWPDLSARTFAAVVGALGEVSVIEAREVLAREQDALTARPAPPDPPRIRTRCPSCGHDTLFIGSGGWLVCSWLECKSPGAINHVADALFTAPPDPPAGPRCADCGCLLNAGEAKAFTCCDACWRKVYPPEANK